MSKYTDFPPVTGDTTADHEKRCRTCGERFESIFQEADHLLVEGEEPFDPYLVISSNAKMNIGTLLRKIHDEADDANTTRAIVEEAYTIMYMADKNPRALNSSLSHINDIN